MRLINEAEEANDFVVATNQVYTIRDLVQLAGKNFGFDIVFEGEGLHERGFDKKTGAVIVRLAKYFRPSDVGDFSKIKSLLGWEPSTSFEQMIDIMCLADQRELTLQVSSFKKSLI